jgi:hypothetical protein
MVTTVDADDNGRAATYELNEGATVRAEKKAQGVVAVLGLGLAAWFAWLGVHWDLDLLGCLILVAAAVSLTLAAWLFVYEYWGRYEE